MTEDTKKQGCQHLNDPTWNKWWCGDCGSYCTRCGCVGPKSDVRVVVLNEDAALNLVRRQENDIAIFERMIKLMLHYIYNNDFPYDVCETQYKRYNAEQYDDYCQRWGDDCSKCAYDYFFWKAKQELEREQIEKEG